VIDSWSDSHRGINIIRYLKLLWMQMRQNFIHLRGINVDQHSKPRNKCKYSIRSTLKTTKQVQIQYTVFALVSRFWVLIYINSMIDIRIDIKSFPSPYFLFIIYVYLSVLIRELRESYDFNPLRYSIFSEYTQIQWYVMRKLLMHVRCNVFAF
jgi:hypothetical protein